MSAPVLATKLYIPQYRQNVVVRPRLREQLNASLRYKLTLLSAPAGFGKTTLLSEWCATHRATPTAWLSLEEDDSTPARFLTYLVAALQTLAVGNGNKIAPQLGKNILPGLEAPLPPPPQAVLTTLLNELAAVSQDFILVLDDYHLVDSAPVDDALTFLVEHLPPQMHLVIATRQDPQLPLAQLRARDQLLELRAADLRFTFPEAAAFLNQAMGLNLAPQEIEQLETRTEGWVAGLQLAALALSSNRTAPASIDRSKFIESFTGSHRFVLDYLLEQVLRQQPEPIQNFLLRTSILERLCGPLSDAVLQAPAGSGKETLAYLERANLFLFALDDERHWYRYHHLFGDLLRQRLRQHVQQPLASAPSEPHASITTLHERASVWYESNGMMFDAFRHAAAANNIERATVLLESEQMPFHFPGAVNTILDWLNSLPKDVLDANPALWWRSAALSLIIGITTGVQEKLQAAEDGLQAAGLVPSNTEGLTDKTRNLIGRIATARATLALTRYQLDAILVQSQRALEYLGPHNLRDRTSAYWTQSVAYFFMGERAAARDAVNQAMQLAQASGSNFSLLLATTTSGTLQEVENELAAAAETYRRALELAGEPALSFASDAQLGLARIYYEWNDLDTAQFYADKSLGLARQYDKVIDRYLLNLVFLARVQLARGDAFRAQELLAEAEHDARTKGFALRLPEIAVQQVLTLLHQGDTVAAAQLAETIKQPMIQARVLVAQGNARAALVLLEQYQSFVQAKHWADEELRILVLQAVALYAAKERANSFARLGAALAMAEPSSFIRLFADEGEPMRALLLDFRSRARGTSYVRETRHAYVEKILATFTNPPRTLQSNIENLSRTDVKDQKSEIMEPLSERELEILRLIAQGYSNQEICERLFLALSTVKGHNRVLFDKLQVKNRTEAVARARALGLI